MNSSAGRTDNRKRIKVLIVQRMHQSLSFIYLFYPASAYSFININKDSKYRPIAGKTYNEGKELVSLHIIGMPLVSPFLFILFMIERHP